RHPALRERAPLRQINSLIIALLAVAVVTPLFVSGLRCGLAMLRALNELAEVTPLFVSGLRCGVALGLALLAGGGVTPLFVSGLRCGLRGDTKTRMETYKSPRSS